jgi:uncharacterized surface protein with fasciclin (FAS1) repeats
MNARTNPSRRLALLAAVAASLMLPACSGGNEEKGADGATAEVSNDTLAKEIADADNLSVVSGALGDAGLAAVFDNAAAYTIFTPEDSAFDALGDPGKQLREPAQRPALIAILRDHIVPGYLTPEDISNAIDVADDKKVKMRTMGGHTLTFTSQGNAITVTNEDGSSAKFAGNALRASNGVAIPLDGVLKKVETPAA